jgi:hypothetical protein
MIRALPLLALVLAGCHGPAWPFEDLPATRIEVAGSVFDVRVRGELAEAIRVNPQYAPRFGPIRARAGFAMAQISGCEVVGVLGDQAVATGVLDCGARVQVPVILVPPVYSCLDINQWTTRADGSDFVEFECDPI